MEKWNRRVSIVPRLGVTSVLGFALLTGCSVVDASEPGSAPSAKPALASTPFTTRPPVSSSTEPSTQTTLPMTSCRELLDSGWTAPVAEPEITYDPASGIAVIILGHETLTLDVLNDDACKHVPFIGPLVVQLLADAKTFD